MSTATIGVQSRIRARRAGFLSEVMAIATRALRSIPLDTESVIGPLIFPVFLRFARRYSGQDHQTK